MNQQVLAKRNKLFLVLVWVKPICEDGLWEFIQPINTLPVDEHPKFKARLGNGIEKNTVMILRPLEEYALNTTDGFERACLHADYEYLLSLKPKYNPLTDDCIILPNCDFIPVEEIGHSAVFEILGEVMPDIDQGVCIEYRPHTQFESGSHWQSMVNEFIRSFNPRYASSNYD